MKNVLLHLKKYTILLLIVFSYSSCENELEKFPTITFTPCESTNVVVNPNIINDFECQSNIVLANVEAVRNPAEIQINKSRFVGKYINSDAAAKNISIDLSKTIDFKNFAIFKIKIRTEEEESKINVRLEGGKTGAINREQNITADNGWNEYTFDFSDFSNEEHNKLTLSFNSPNSGAIYYLDDLSLDASKNICEGIDKDKSIVNDFDCQKNVIIPEVEKVLTPNKSPINESNFSGKYVDGLGAWDAVIIDYKEAIDLSINNIFSIKVHAPVAGTLKVKLEGGTSAAIEKDQQVIAGEWKEYTFNFLDQATENHTKIVLFFNAGVDTNGTDEYFIDDLRFIEDPCANTVADTSILNDFDCQVNRNPEGNVTTEVVENPNKNANNTSLNVLKVTDNGTEPFDFLVFDNTEAIDLTSKNILKIKVHSSKSVPLLAKLEGGTSTPSEIWGTIDTVGDWKEYSFDFSSQANEQHNKVVFFFNGGQTDGTTEDIYFIDDIKFVEANTISCTGVVTDETIVSDAECQQNYTIEGDAATTVIDNPNKSGINNSEAVLEVRDNGTNAWDHLLFNFGKSIDLSTKNVLKIKVLSSKNAPLLAKLEGGTSAANEIWGAINTTGTWTEYTFDFSSQASKDHQKIVFFFNAGEATGANPDIYYIDDIRWE
ncbi:carbohydrate binding domain-containing protein [Polaribacter cellanae]|uniref:Carbohydrate binding domain-containing protein n=1 Tax=Polaribacter cellanae TaxID=2818493 RepID=A0A975CM05_9FLAO|nr:carbohydrate binding domain-containing protein [Polaribacter cellanae]QTE22401.1 carbohydrate binding domain-containing protein [Polaribacter cellanae]